MFQSNLHFCFNTINKNDQKHIAAHQQPRLKSNIFKSCSRGYGLKIIQSRKSEKGHVPVNNFT